MSSLFAVIRHYAYSFRCPTRLPYETIPGGDPAPILGDGGRGGHVEQTGNFEYAAPEPTDEPEPDPTEAPVPDPDDLPPFPTWPAVPDVDPYCYGDNNGDGSYASFTKGEAEELAQAFCPYEFLPSDQEGLVLRTESGLVGGVVRAADQDGCDDRNDYYFFCNTMWDLILERCDDASSSGDEAYGGGYTYDSSTAGCVAEFIYREG